MTTRLAWSRWLFYSSAHGRCIPRGLQVSRFKLSEDEIYNVIPGTKCIRKNWNGCGYDGIIGHQDNVQSWQECRELARTTQGFRHQESLKNVLTLHLMSELVLPVGGSDDAISARMAVIADQQT